MRLLLDRRRNPFFDHGNAAYFLAERAGRPVGRIAAIVNRLHNEIHQDRTGFFGFFECEDDQAAASRLLDTAATWVADRGMDVLRGPASFSSNDEFGLLVEGHDSPTSLMMPYTPPWYARLVEGAGGRLAKVLLTYRGEGMEAPDRLTRATEVLQARHGVTVRPLRLADFDAEVERIQELYNRIWEDNWGYIPLTEREIVHLAKQFRPIVVPALAPFVEKDGVPIGFALALPDLNEVFRSNRSGYLLPVLPRLLWSLRPGKLHRMRILLLGVDKAFRGKGIDAMLYHQLWTQANARGISVGEAGWILEDNPLMRTGLEKIGFRVNRKYRIYDLPVRAS